MPTAGIVGNNYRLFDRHLLPVVSLAVLCDDSAEWRGKKQGLEQGKKQGLEQGKKQGFLLGEASVVLHLLKRLLKRRFERIPGWVEERLERASRVELEGWLDRALEAKALEDVFA